MDYEPIPIISQNFVPIVVPVIDATKLTIDIIVFEWRFYRKGLKNNVSLFNDAIARAVARGVRVRCLVRTQSAVEELKKMGCLARTIPTRRLLHNKLLICDNSRVVIGSHNYTQHAFSSNYESSIMVVVEPQKNTFAEYFNNLFGLYE